MQHLEVLTDGSALAGSLALVLFHAFRETSPTSWPTMELALAEAHDQLEPAKINIIARDDEGEVVGWIAATPHYAGRVWEVHPLAVRPGHQRKGMGSQLLAALGEEAANRGGITLWTTCDDETGGTSLFGKELYPEPLEELRRVKGSGSHPLEFYRKHGFAVVGVMPDANGVGKPDIYLAKRLCGNHGADGDTPVVASVAGVSLPKAREQARM